RRRRYTTSVSNTSPSTVVRSPGDSEPIGAMRVLSSYREGNTNNRSWTWNTPSRRNFSASTVPTPRMAVTGRCSAFNSRLAAASAKVEDAFDFNTGPPRQLRHADRGSRRIWLRAVGRHDFVHPGEVGEIGQKHIHLDRIREASAGGFGDRLEIFEHAADLR